MKKLLWLWVTLTFGAVLLVGYSRLSISKKRYLGYLLRQVPAMAARYFV
ncbi:MAG: hypothetical protein ACK2T7_04110 [Anaerolineales bacterium]|jgi:hypothetical protein